MLGDPLSNFSRTAEKQRIAANWLRRIKESLSAPHEAAAFNDAIRAAHVDIDASGGFVNVSQEQLDAVVAEIINTVPDISLRMFARAELSDLGVMGYAAINSDTVGHAMQILYRYHELTSDRYYDSIEIEGEMAIVSPTPVMSHIQNSQNIAEDSLAGNWRTLGLLLGPERNSQLAIVRFSFEAPAYRETYDQVFECPVYFGEQRNELAFPASWLSRPVASANQTLADVCTAMCDRLMGAASADRDTPQLVRRLLLSRPGRRMYRLEEAAGELNLSTPQLRKRLYKAGTNYKRLVLETRMALARHYLEDTNLAVQEVAYLLDYAQPAPFSRAFKSYFGVSPEASRRESQLN
jgi:AraC-like DNA-binding protein